MTAVRAKLSQFLNCSSINCRNLKTILCGISLNSNVRARARALTKGNRLNLGIVPSDGEIETICSFFLLLWFEIVARNEIMLIGGLMECFETFNCLTTMLHWWSLVVAFSGEISILIAKDRWRNSIARMRQTHLLWKTTGIILFENLKVIVLDYLL